MFRKKIDLYHSQNHDFSILEGALLLAVLAISCLKAVPNLHYGIRCPPDDATVQGLGFSVQGFGFRGWSKDVFPVEHNGIRMYGC